MDENSTDVVCEVPVAFDSSDGTSTIRGRVWCHKKDGQGFDKHPRALILLVHGMGEHSGRYRDFADELCAHGFVVAAYDHVGHGLSSHANSWGKLTQNSDTIMVNDAHQMRLLAESFVPKQTPVFILGHSMGSFVVRVYLKTYAQGLRGAILSGTAYIEHTKAVMSLALAKSICKAKGDAHISRLLTALSTGAYSRSIKGATSDFDWLSYNQANIDAYRADGACGFPFSAGGIVSLIKLLDAASSSSTIESYPKDLPLLFVSGADDPVGEMGKGVTKCFNACEKAHIKDVEYKLYQGMRHEILNELGKDVVVTDIVEWLFAHTV